jgi:4-azaleucine resistance transporter AzlC|tara:strand:- start:722 stop:1417 length:696 start_codon:yes stop_codon:yes gene_type:complete
MNGKTKNFFKASIDVLPLLIPVVPFGIIFGAIGIELGFGPYVTYATSIIIFSGASQIVFFQLLSAGASSIVAITSSSVISTRHLLYGAVMNQYLSNLSIYWKIGLSYILTDQAFAVSNEYFKKNKKDKFKHYYLLGAGVTLWITWQITTVIGILLGSIVPEELGLTFTIPLTFLALLINYFRKIDHVIVIIASGVLSIIMYDAPFKSYIIFSSLISLLIAYLIVKMRKQNI